ncbi:MAG: ankyrin repeat domain-containing protein [Minisyncoccia bacterium]
MKKNFIAILLFVAQVTALQAAEEAEREGLKILVGQREDSFGYKRKEYRIVPEPVIIDLIALTVAANEISSLANRQIIKCVAEKIYKNGETMLHHASLISGIMMAELLIKYGAVVDVKDQNGKTPLHYAVDNQKPNFVKRLLAYGARVDGQDSGESPMDLALRCAQQYPHKNTPLLIIEAMSAAHTYSEADATQFQEVQDERCRQALETGRNAALKYMKRPSDGIEIEEIKYIEISKFLDTLIWEC